MKKMIFSLLLPAVLPLFAEAPDEEQFGARIYFRCDNFENGNYRDYFQRAFKGSLEADKEGFQGILANVTYGESRPFRVTPGKKYRLSFRAFNTGAKDLSKYKADGPRGTFPTSFQFYDDAWKTVKMIKGQDIPGAFAKELPPARWTDHSYSVEAPEGAAMFVFGIASNWKNCWGPYLIADIQFTEEK